MMRRRDFIRLLGGTAAWPVAARAQQRALPMVGYLGVTAAEQGVTALAAFRKGLAEAGFMEGRNVTLELRWMGGDFSRLAELTADILRLAPAVIFAGSPPSVRAAMAATKAVPIVFMIGEDPVKEGLVASLNRPGGNVTGLTDFANQLGGKRLGLLHDVVPKATSISFLVDATNPNAEPDTKDMQAAAAVRGVQLPVFPIADESEFERAFADMAQRRVGALIVNTAPRFAPRMAEIVGFSARHAIPTLYERREFPLAGGLLSYGPDRVDSARQAGLYVGRILKGEKPVDLPVQQTTKQELVINLKTAKALGLEIPSGILAIADEVIE